MRVRKITWVFVAFLFVITCAFAARPNAWLQLAAMLALLTALVYLVTLLTHGAIRWREHGLVNVISCLLVALSIPAAVLLGHSVRSAAFSYNLERWNRAVIWVVSHKQPNSDGPIELPPQYEDLAYGVHYTTDQLCGLTVDFFWGGGFPVKHTVRRYATKPEWIDMKQCRKDWSRGRHLTGNWYEISD